MVWHASTNFSGMIPRSHSWSQCLSLLVSPEKKCYSPLEHSKRLIVEQPINRSQYLRKIHCIFDDISYRTMLAHLLPSNCFCNIHTSFKPLSSWACDRWRRSFRGCPSGARWGSPEQTALCASGVRRFDYRLGRSVLIVQSFCCQSVLFVLNVNIEFKDECFVVNLYCLYLTWI